ncbi:TEF transcription factor, PAR bZIP family member b isoform X1 [Osmerus mordax]|uniref:TEF transcription factor, PAR bZIP family member b isoform X1 n=1 Tax=Osmerus mordax TaxID=8014 RepID=UPI0035106E79
MAGKATIDGALELKSSPQKSFPFVLKKIMDIPPPNILDEGDDEIEKEKLCSSENVETGSGGGGSGAGGTGGSGGGVSASLTPAIWEKTIPYDGEKFHLEYMDLDEFLLENGISSTLEEELQKSLTQEEDNESKAPSTSASATISSASEIVTITLKTAKMEQEEEEEEEEGREDEDEDDDQDSVSVADAAEVELDDRTDGKAVDRDPPSPIDPEAIEVDVNFQPDPTDLVLSSVPGGELFNPRKHKFSDEELKPQPMIKKAKKVFVPNEQKDDKYWSRRKKNNMAAKRSRDARRLKENQITVRASFLERENAALRQQVAELRKDCGRCKNTMARYEVKYGPLTRAEALKRDM